MLAETQLSPQELAELWQQFSEDESLPDDYELSEYGELIISPSPTNRHQRICTEIAFQLREQLGGEAVVEVAVMTKSAGVRKPDVTWMPSERWNVVRSGAGLLDAPEIAVEVRSPGDRRARVAYKVRAYLASGVREVIVVGLDGSVVFHRADGEHAQSAFDVRLDLPRHFFD